MTTLNEMTAVAMGWTSLRVERLRRPGGISGGGGYPGGGDYWESLCGNPPDGSSPPPLIRHVPKFDTNPATIPEMLAFLTARGRTVGINAMDSAVETWLEGEWYGNKSPRGYGSTINESLARLVCAVAEAKKP